MIRKLRDKKNLLICFSVCLVLLLLVVLVFIINQNGRNQDVDESVTYSVPTINEFKLEVKDVERKSLTLVIKPVINTDSSVTINVAHVELRYDPEVLTGTSINEDSKKFITLLEEIDDKEGTISFDIAKIGRTYFKSDEEIAKIEFEIDDNAKLETSIAFDRASQLGQPDTLNKDQIYTVNIDLVAIK